MRDSDIKHIPAVIFLNALILNKKPHLWMDAILNMLYSTDKIKGTELADQVCEKFGFLNPCGEEQRTGCLESTGGVGTARGNFSKSR